MIRILVCSLCKKHRREHLVLFGRNICRECEAFLIHTQADDDAYRRYMEEMKEILSGAAKE